MRYLWTLIGTIFFLILIPVTISFYKDYQVYTNGKIIKAVITHLPSGYSSKKDFMDFKFNGLEFHKRVNSSFTRSHRIGDVVELRYLSGNESHFLLLNESPVFWGIANFLLFTIFGVWSFYYAYKKQPLA